MPGCAEPISACSAEYAALRGLHLIDGGGTQPNVKRFFGFQGAPFDRRSGSKLCPVSIILQTTFRNRSARAIVC